MTTATEETTKVHDAILITVSERMTLNFKGAKAQKVYIHLHGGETLKLQSRGRTVAQLVDNLRAVDGIEVEMPKHLAAIAATKVVAIADQKLVSGEPFAWSVAVPAEKDDAAKAAADAAKHAKDDGRPMLIFGDEMIDSGEPLIVLEYDPTGD